MGPMFQGNYPYFVHLAEAYTKTSIVPLNHLHSIVMQLMLVLPLIPFWFWFLDMN